MKIRINNILGMIGIAVALAGCNKGERLAETPADVSCTDGSKFENVRHDYANYQQTYYLLRDVNGNVIARVPVAICVVRYRR
jgi:hypothetical protein